MVQRHQSNTVGISQHSAILRRLLKRHEYPLGIDPLNHECERELSLFIRGMVEPLPLYTRTATILGRFDPDSGDGVDVDLTPYAAAAHGVSRIHAKLELLDDENLYITDLGSTNGTFVAGDRLEAYKPYLLHHMTHVVLGRLPIRVLYEHPITAQHG